ncbi:MAG: nucleotidyltransferase family protein [Arenimonas sp.]|nr:nucleotidyltransferase family protein [Arenimonas sp.]
MTARDDLASYLARAATPWPASAGLEAAMAEDVVALVDARIRSAPSAVPEAVQRAFADAARGEAAQLMLRQAETRRVLARFAQAGLPVLMLKGSALAYWAYPAPHLRRCADVDLLFASRSDALAAAALLADDGYALRQHFGEAATREFLCRRNADTGAAIEMDMHWALSSAPVFADRFTFAELMAASIPLPALAPGARGLCAVHALLHACLHRASDLSNGGGEKLKWLYDLHVLAGALDAAGWEQLRALAVERGLAGVCTDGLAEAARLFGTPLPEREMAVLRVAASEETIDVARLRGWIYFQRQNLRALPDARSRLLWIWQRLRPTAHYREDVGVAGIGLLGDRIRRALRQLRR